MTTTAPKWWNNEHDTAWQRTKAAVKRDWEQTKADLTGGGRDLNQDLTDTVKQATGNAPIPSPNTPNAPDAGDLKRHARKAEKAAGRWEDSEEHVRYGYGAGRHYKNSYPEAEGELRREWSATYPDRNYDDVRDDVQLGWNQSRRSS